MVEGAYELEGTVPTTGVRLVRCPDWGRGPGASLRCGLRALEDDVEAAVVIMADGPDRSPAAVVGAPVHSMSCMNGAARVALLALPHRALHACTDIPGFGLIGH